MSELFKQICRLLFRTNHQQKHLDKKAFLYFRKCKNILDVGCGIGSFIAFDPKRIMGIDTNSETIKFCRDMGYSVKKGSAIKLPFKSNSLDGVHCSHVIEHLQPKEAYAFLMEVNRVLKKRGIFVLQTPLLWSGFYNNLTHVKPYNPDAIMRYLVYTAPDTTFPQIKGKFKKVALQWRYRPILNILYPLGIHTLKKDAYMLVLQKLE